MRAVGARRRQVALVYLRTTMLLGAGGALVGSRARDRAVEPARPLLRLDLLGGRRRLRCRPGGVAGQRARRPRWPRRWPRCRRSGGACASTCGRRSRRAARRSVAEGAADRAAARAGFLPRTMQIGLRNIGRRKRRSLATASIVALAVGNLLAVLGPGGGRDRGHAPPGATTWRTCRSPPAGGRSSTSAPSTPSARHPGGRGRTGAKNAAGWLARRRSCGRWSRSAVPLPPRRWPLVRRRGTGRPSTSRGDRAQHRPVVGVGVGDQVTLDTAAGDAEFRIVGIANNQQENGTALYVPLTTARELLGQPTGARRLLDQDGDVRAGIRRPHHQPAGGPAGDPRLRGRERDHLRRRAGRGGGQPLADHLDRRARLRHRGHEHGRARQRHHHQRARAHPRDRHPAQHRGPGPRRPPHLHHRRHRTASPGGSSASRSATRSTRLLVWLVWEVVDVRLPVVVPAVRTSSSRSSGRSALPSSCSTSRCARAVRFRPGDALRYA